MARQASGKGRETGCIIFAHGIKMMTNQGLGVVTCALLTILSTQNVQKCTAPAIVESDQSLSLAQRWISWFFRRKTAKNTIVLNFYSRQKIPYKSTTFHVVGGIANNLVHSKCGEVHIDTNAGFWPVIGAFFLRRMKISL
jgi:hypothetical protein